MPNKCKFNHCFWGIRLKTGIYIFTIYFTVVDIAMIGMSTHYLFKHYGLKESIWEGDSSNAVNNRWVLTGGHWIYMTVIHIALLPFDIIMFTAAKRNSRVATMISIAGVCLRALSLILEIILIAAFWTTILNIVLIAAVFVALLIAIYALIILIAFFKRLISQKPLGKRMSSMLVGLRDPKHKGPEESKVGRPHSPQPQSVKPKEASPGERYREPRSPQEPKSRGESPSRGEPSPRSVSPARGEPPPSRPHQRAEGPSDDSLHPRLRDSRDSPHRRQQPESPRPGRYSPPVTQRAPSRPSPSSSPSLSQRTTTSPSTSSSPSPGQTPPRPSSAPSERPPPIPPKRKAPEVIPPKTAPGGSRQPPASVMESLMRRRRV